MRTTFVMLSVDEAPLLEHSLPAAVAEGFDAGVVIDNASTDATGELADQFGVPRLRLPRRVSYNEAVNTALRQVDADAVALLTGDTFVSPGYLRACVAALVDPEVGSVAPKLVRTLGPAQADRLSLIDAAAMSFDRRRKNNLVGHGTPANLYSTPTEAFGPDGAAAFWRVSALQDCAVEGKYFDENMPGWGCDADLAWRAQLLGWRTMYEPAAVVHHIRTYSPTTRSAVRPEDRRTQFRNRLLMIAKNDTLREMAPDLVPLLSYEVLALGYAVLREHELLGGYAEAWRRLPEARRQRRLIQSRRRVSRVPLGLEPPR